MLVRLKAAEEERHRNAPAPPGTLEGEAAEEEALEKAVAARRKTLAPAADPAAAVREAVAAIPEIPDFSGPADPFAPAWAGPDSPEVGARKLIEAAGGPEALLGLRADLAVRLIQWLEADAPAALAFIKDVMHPPPDPFASGFHPTMKSKSAPALKVWEEGLPMDEGLNWMRKSSYDLRQEMARGLMARAAGEGGAMSFERILDAAAGPSSEPSPGSPPDPFAGSVPTAAFEQWVQDGINRWPYEMLDPLVAMAVKRSDGNLLQEVLMRLTPADLCAKLPGLLDTTEGRDAFAPKEELNYPAHMNADSLVGRVYQNRAMPLPERLALCGRLISACAAAREASPEDEDKNSLEYAVHLKPSPEKLAAHLADTVETLDYHRFQDEGAADALAHQFLSGAMDAREARAAMAAAMSEGGAPDPETLQQVIEPALSALDPVRALALLDGLPPEERAGRTVGMANHWPFRPTPQQFFAFQKAMAARASDGGALFQGFWESFTKEQDCDWYRQWVPSLPAGKTRDAALSALAARVRREDPARAEALRAMRSEPEPEDGK